MYDNIIDVPSHNGEIFALLSLYYFSDIGQVKIGIRQERVPVMSLTT